MATVTRTVESLDSPRAVDVKIVEPRSLEASVKIAQGVPDPRSVNKLIRLLRPHWRYSSRQNHLSPQTAAELIDDFSTRPKTTNVQQATTEAIKGKPPFSGRTPIPKSLEPNIKLPPDVQSSDAAAIADLSVPNHGLQLDAQNSDATAIEEAAPTAGAAQPTNTTNNLGQPEQTDKPSQILSDREENIPSARSAVTVGPVTSNHAGVQRVLESEISSIPSPQPIQQNAQSLPSEFKFIGPNSQTGRRSLWGKVPAFRRFSENVYLATKISPRPEYANQWQEKWEPTLRQELYDLSIDQNDIFTFDLRMAGASEDEASMKPTILVICNQPHKNSIENKLGPLVKQTVPKEVRFQVIGRRISTASPSGARGFDGIDLSVEFKASNYPLGTLMGSVARIYSHENIQSAPGFALSTIGGLIAVGDELYALTTAHSLFKGFSYGYPPSSDFKPCGKVQCYKWLKHASETHFQNRLETPMDWALISIPNELASPNYFLIDKATRVGGEVVGFAKNNEFLSEEDVWICSSSKTQCGILSSTLVSFHLDGATFEARTVMLEHCLVDGDSGSWIVSQTTHKLCGYVFAKVDEFELAYMLPIEPVFNDISEEFSKKTKCSVDIPDWATIHRLKDMTKDKYIEELGQTPEPPARSPPAPPASLTSRERLGEPDDSLERLPKVNSNSLAFESYQPVFSASKATELSSDHVRPAFSVRRKEITIKPDSPGAPAQKSPEMQQIGSPFGSYPPLTPIPYFIRPVATNQTVELPLPGHEKPLSKPKDSSQEEVDPSLLVRRDNSDDAGPLQSRNPYKASMMAIKPAPAQLPSSDDIGSLPPPSRKAPKVPQVERESGFSRHRKPSITKRFRRWVRQYWLTIFVTSLLLVVSFGLLAASGYLIYFIVRKRHFSTVAKVFSIWGAVAMGPGLISIPLYIFRRRNRAHRDSAQPMFEDEPVEVYDAAYTTQNEAIGSFVNDDSGVDGAEVSEMSFRVNEIDGSAYLHGENP